MAERAYVEGKIFTRNAEGGDHLDHVFRLKTQRELSGDISVHGGDLSVILEQPAPLRRRKEGNYYYEVVGYAEGAEMEKIRLWLEKETGHRCVAVTHRDESKPHTHFLIPWTGQDRRALRLSKGSFWKINQFVAGAVGRQLTPRGQGRQKLPPGLIMGNPEEAARIIEGDKQRIARQLDGIGAMIDLYGPIELAAIGDKGRLVLKTVDNVDQVSLKQLMKFARRGDGIYFRPAERETHRVLFLDDVPEKALPNVPGTLVETSPGKYQVHVSLDSPVNTEQARAIQRYLCNFYEADRGCGPDVYHFRRVPGFTNQKYTDKPPVEIQERAEALRDKPYSTGGLSVYF